MLYFLKLSFDTVCENTQAVNRKISGMHGTSGKKPNTEEGGCLANPINDIDSWQFSFTSIFCLWFEGVRGCGLQHHFMKT